MSFFSFDYDPNVKFDMFTSMHVLMLVLFAIYVLLFILFKDRIYASRNEKKIRHIFGYVLIVNLIILILIESFGGHLYLPFHLCSISYILTIMLVFTGNEKLFKYVYFAGVLGGFISFAIPDLYHSGYNRYRFYEFILAHGSIILIPMYYLVKYKYRIEFRDLVRGVIITNILGFAMFPVNYVLRTTGLIKDANFMFTQGPPSDVESIFGTFPLHLLSFEAVLIILFTVLYFGTKMYQDKVEVKEKRLSN